MINDVITAISRTLDERFGCPIHAEPVEQGLTPPCFIINIVDAESEPLLYKRSNRVYNFDVVYISKSGAYSEMYSVADKLIAALNTVTMIDGTQLLAYDKRYEIVDGDMHFFMTYQMPVIETEDKDPMESYSLSSEIGGI